MNRRLRKLWPPRLMRDGVQRARWCLETWRAAKEVAHRHGLSPMAVIREQAGLFRRHRLDQHSYYSYRLYEPHLSADEKARYIPDCAPANHQLWALLVPRRYRLLYDNKLVFNRFFGAVGLPVATIHGVFEAELGHTPDGRSLRTAAELGARLREIGGPGFVFKPMEGIRGDRVLVFSGAAPDDPDAWVTLAGERYDAERLVAATADGAELVAHNPGADTRRFLIEERVRPHPTLEELLGPTLCSVRVQTIVSRAGAPEILAAVFKLQTGTSGVDHLLHGAVGCWVEPETGVLGRGRSRTDDRDVSTIPGTDRSFIGLQLPEWDAVRDVALRAAAAFPWARSIGWDIGVSERGPLLIEGNERWSPSLIQMPAPRGLMTGEMKALCDELSSAPRPSSKSSRMNA
ncbi:MAG: hypothetical protein H0T44_07730 [Gemmatimonadales bacterium]|nr:hypothetical protein [Gemmatimonadales bacterium]